MNKHIKAYEDFVNESKINENKWIVFLPIKKDSIVDIDSDQFGVYTDHEYDKYAPFDVYGGPDYTTSLSFPDKKKAQEFADLVKKAKGDMKSSEYAKATEFESKNKISESLNEGSYDMYTPAGDRAAQKLVDGIVAKINGDKKMTGADVEKLLKDGVAKVAKTHREVHDTEPRGEIAHQITKALKAAGYSFYFNSYGDLNESTFSVEDGIKIQSEQLAQWKKLLQPKVYKDLEKWATEHNDKAESGNQIVRGTDMDNFIGNYFNNYTPSNKRMESLVNEGQFSWMTQDTGKQIGSEKENTIAVTMFDDKGNKWLERKYDGYGEFGGKDYYELLAQMNGIENADRQDGIDIAFGKKKVKGKTLFPALVENPNRFNYKRHDFTQEADNDPNQSWYQEWSNKT